MNERDDRRTDPNDDTGGMPIPDSDAAPTYYGLENAVPDTLAHMAASEQPAGEAEEEPVVASIEVIHPQDFIKQVWPDKDLPT